jgi:hypothetical protein
MVWCRPTLKVAQQRPEGVPALPSGCASRPLCRVVRDSRNTLLATAQADSAETFTVYNSAQRALSYREGGVFLRAKSRHGDK